jgi:hypothetical protein
MTDVFAVMSKDWGVDSIAGWCNRSGVGLTHGGLSYEGSTA